MKLGLISDIHADLDHLRRALDLLRALGADQILCAGDVVDGETEGEAAAQFFRQQEIACVEGNHDRLMSDPALAGIATRFPPRNGIPPTDDQLRADVLSADTIAYLRALPMHLRLERDARRVLLTHASTWSLDSYISPDEHPEHFLRLAQEADANIVIVGHTHVPMAVEVEGTWIFNPGAVYDGRRPPYTPTCALLDLNPMRYRVYNLLTGQPSVYLFARVNTDVHNSHTFEHVEHT